VPGTTPPTQVDGVAQLVATTFETIIAAFAGNPGKDAASPIRNTLRKDFGFFTLLDSLKDSTYN
jgi:hypothetical protein